MKSRNQRTVFRELLRARRTAPKAKASLVPNYNHNSPLTPIEFIIRQRSKAASSRRPSMPILPWSNTNDQSQP